MKKSHYLHYTAVDLLNDGPFLDSTQHPTEESEELWAQLEEGNEGFSEELRKARHFLRMVAESPQKQLPADEVARLWEQISREVAMEKKAQRRKRFFLLRVADMAACISVLVLCGYFVFSLISSYEESSFHRLADIPQPDSDGGIQLILSEGRKVSIGGKEGKLQYKEGGKIAIRSGTTRVYEESKAGNNQLIVPTGKRSFITFSDGTRIAVNANTRVVYPSEFSAHKREIYVNGEVYLQVFPDKTRPFIVKTDRMEVEVLGTKFDVNAYGSAENQSVILVSGKVEVDTHGYPKKVLKPNEMLTYDGKEHGWRIKTVDVSGYISWVDGYYCFKRERLEVIAEKLSQYYGIRVTADSGLAGLTCSGKLDLRDNLQDVLETLGKTMPLRIESGDNYFLLTK